MASTLPAVVRERFDLVGFDPRGVANSTPALWCNSDADNDRLRADNVVEYTPEGVAHIENDTKEFVQRCVDKMGKEFLANIGTASVVKDLDAIRTALGDDKLTYLGYSYGTRIGAGYAEAYPAERARDDPRRRHRPQRRPDRGRRPPGRRVPAGVQRLRRRLRQRLGLPAGHRPGQGRRRLPRMVDPLVEKPAKTKDPRGLSYSDAIVGTILPLYSPNLWRHLTQALGEIEDGKGDTMLALADLYMGRDAEGPLHQRDRRPRRRQLRRQAGDHRPAPHVVEQDRRIREVAPFMSYGEFTGHAPMSTCAFWPVPPTSTPHEISSPGLPPVLVVSTTNDPATPYQAGVDLAKQLGGTLLTFEGTQHTVVFQGNKCIDDIAARYLVDVTVPPADTRC